MSDSMGPVVGMVVYGLFFVGIIVALIIKQRKGNDRLATLANGLQATPATKWFTLSVGRQFTGEYEGGRYVYEFFAGSRNSPPYFKISIPFVSPGDYLIAPETWFDRLGKQLGLSVEIQTGDSPFDQRVYIQSNTVEFAQRYFADIKKRQAILALLDAGFTQIACDGKQCVVTQSPCLINALETAKIIEVIKVMKSLMINPPEYYSAPAFSGVPTWKLAKWFFQTVNLVTLVLGVFACAVAFGWYSPLDGGKFFFFSLHYSVPAVLVGLGLEIFFLKGRSSSHKDIVPNFFMTLIGFPLIIFAGLVFYNGHYDISPLAQHRALVGDRYVTHSKSSTYYHISVVSWRRPGWESFEVGYNLYHSLAAGRSYVIVKTQPGKLGFEWLDGIEGAGDRP